MKKLKDFHFWCWLGFHDWYHGSFVYPVEGRYERHCLECEKKQYYEKSNWITFKNE